MLQAGIIFEVILVGLLEVIKGHAHIHSKQTCEELWRHEEHCHARKDEHYIIHFLAMIRESVIDHLLVGLLSHVNLVLSEIKLVFAVRHLIY